MAEGQKRAARPVMVTAEELEHVLNRGGEIERQASAANARAARARAKAQSEEEKIICSILAANPNDKVITLTALVNEEFTRRGLKTKTGKPMKVLEKTIERRLKKAREDSSHY